MKDMIIAIDGPAGSGKSTIASLLAKKKGLLYIDTGAMYRALTFKALQSNIDLNDAEALIRLAQSTDIKIENDRHFNTRVFLDGKDVTERIRDLEVTNNVFYLAQLKDVRQIMVELQRKIARGKSVVIEGRDTTTVVFPNADLKIYLDADLKERVKRRAKDLRRKCEDVDLTLLKEQIIQRDRTDIRRKWGPLRKAEDAYYLDTTNLSISEVLVKIVTLLDSLPAA
jgi:cytidylate kinase